LLPWAYAEIVQDPSRQSTSLQALPQPSPLTKHGEKPHSMLQLVRLTIQKAVVGQAGRLQCARARELKGGWTANPTHSNGPRAPMSDPRLSAKDHRGHVRDKG
jgi:hypothetical protein